MPPQPSVWREPPLPAPCCALTSSTAAACVSPRPTAPCSMASAPWSTAATTATATTTGRLPPTAWSTPRPRRGAGGRARPAPGRPGCGARLPPADPVGGGRLLVDHHGAGHRHHPGRARRSEPFVRLALSWENRSSDHRVRLLVLLARPTSAVDAEGQAAVVRRPLTAEGGTGGGVPAADLPGRAVRRCRRWGVLLARTMEHEVVDTAGGQALALTLLRSIGYLSQRPPSP